MKEYGGRLTYPDEIRKQIKKEAVIVFTKSYLVYNGSTSFSRSSERKSLDGREVNTK